MKQKQVIQIDAEGYFAGFTFADESPLEPGVFLMPAGAIDAPAPSIPEGQRAKWTGEWVLEEIPQPEPEPEPLPEPEPDPKLVGVEFDGVMCSATKDDQSGLTAVLLAVQLQGANFPPTNFYFENGSQLVITKENVQSFMDVWIPFRQSFFAVDET
jgi:hypothetical protein